MRYFVSQTRTKLFLKGQEVEIIEELERVFVIRYRHLGRGAIKTRRIHKVGKFLGQIQEGKAEI